MPFCYLHVNYNVCKISKCNNVTSSTAFDKSSPGYSSDTGGDINFFLENHFNENHLKSGELYIRL